MKAWTIYLTQVNYFLLSTIFLPVYVPIIDAASCSASRQYTPMETERNLFEGRCKVEANQSNTKDTNRAIDATVSDGRSVTPWTTAVPGDHRLVRCPYQRDNTTNTNKRQIDQIGFLIMPDAVFSHATSYSTSADSVLTSQEARRGDFCEKSIQISTKAEKSSPVAFGVGFDFIREIKQGEIDEETAGRKNLEKFVELDLVMTTRWRGLPPLPTYRGSARCFSLFDLLPACACLKINHYENTFLVGENHGR